MPIQTEEKNELERIITRNLKDLSLANSLRLKAGLRVLMTTTIPTFETVSSLSVQEEVKNFKELLLSPEKYAPNSAKSEGSAEVIRFIQQFTLEHLHLLDSRTSILPNATTVVKSVTGGERLKSVVHISAMRNVVNSAHFVDAIAKQFQEEGLAQDLLETQVNVATEAMVRLYKAVIEGDFLDFEKFIKVKGVDVNLASPDGLTLIHLAARENQVKILKILLQHPKININQVSNNGWSALHIAARQGYSEIVNLLSTSPHININAVNSDGWTALHWAAWHGYIDVVTILLNAPNIDLNCVDKTKTTPLQLAARNGHADVIKLILTKPHLEINAQDNENRTALHFAVCFGHFAAAQALLTSEELDVNLLDLDGFTALHWAARNGRMDIVQLLLTKPEIQQEQLDHNDMTAGDWALQNHFQDIANRLYRSKRQKRSLILRNIWNYFWGK